MHSLSKIKPNTTSISRLSYINDKTNPHKVLMVPMRVHKINHRNLAPSLDREGPSAHVIAPNVTPIRYHIQQVLAAGPHVSITFSSSHAGPVQVLAGHHVMGAAACPGRPKHLRVSICGAPSLIPSYQNRSQCMPPVNMQHVSSLGEKIA